MALLWEMCSVQYSWDGVCQHNPLTVHVLSVACKVARGGVDALAMLFSNTDIYDGLTFPGGVPNMAYNTHHARVAGALEQGHSIYSALDAATGSLTWYQRIMYEYALGPAAAVEHWEFDVADAWKGHESNVQDTTQ